MTSARLGFTRACAPRRHPTRIIVRSSLAEFQGALCQWLAGPFALQPPLTAAVDGKTSKQGRDADGPPIHVLNVSASDLRICLAPGGCKDTPCRAQGQDLDERHRRGDCKC
jgi:hypothetical protein